MQVCNKCLVYPINVMRERMHTCTDDDHDDENDEYNDIIFWHAIGIVPISQKYCERHTSLYCIHKYKLHKRLTIGEALRNVTYKLCISPNILNQCVRPMPSLILYHKWVHTLTVRSRLILAGVWNIMCISGRLTRRRPCVATIWAARTSLGAAAASIWRACHIPIFKRRIIIRHFKNTAIDCEKQAKMYCT